VHGPDGTEDVGGVEAIASWYGALSDGLGGVTMHGCIGRSPHLLTGGVLSCPELATSTTGLGTCCSCSGSSVIDRIIAVITSGGMFVMPAMPVPVRCAEWLLATSPSQALKKQEKLTKR